ncbi:peptidoglycan-binding protein LysM [Leuconostoc gelidum]|uniref:peptidoglycan-binding protein LysM n=1 Tax=Leuconostoc gelidum TaxID=1244 RepID=UPI001C7D2AA6|nr:peptidoglycan-binding protein LysM [Leuconostoc gelidum]MBZ6010978.1 peptidoglycan-binding protein LysM [Leuconostoc gelidum subsp. aenigmaticum]
MNDFDPSNMSRVAKNKKKKIEPKFAREAEKKAGEHKGLRIVLIILAFAILASVPVYGSWANKKEPQKQTATSVSRKMSSTVVKATTSSESQSEKSSSSETESSSVEPSSEVSSTPSSSSEAVSSSTADTASSAVGQTAVLGASQTLYNFAITHGMTTDQVVALNPGLTVGNYTQYSGRDLNIQ